MRNTLWILIASVSFAQTSTAPRVNTALGVVEGTAAGNIHSYLGIPFAAPPIGPLRFRPPQPPPMWEGVRLAKTMPPKCAQKHEDGIEGGEDCLYLNVWTRSSARSLPVMVFVHGGGNIQGSVSEGRAGQYIYDGGRIVENADVVVVTVQYRLGMAGNLALPALAEESDHKSAGNYGLLDIIASLRWVRENIAAFGGDPGRVMLFGESAGAVNTCSLLASPLAAGLFQRALMQSGACTAATLEERFEEGAEFARSIGCDTLECLRAVPIEKIVSAMQSSAVNPDGTASRFVGAAIDGWVLPAAPIEVIRRRQHNAVPFVIGSNADETAGFGVPPMTEAAYRATILRIFGPLIGAEVLREYPARQFDSPREALVAVTTDAQFTCTARTVARAVTDAQTPPVYRYFFTYPAVPALGATHGIELRYVFQAADDALARTFLAYWTSFAADGVPAGPDQPLWTRYQSAADPYMELNNPARMERGVRTEKWDFWDRLAARAR